MPPNTTEVSSLPSTSRSPEGAPVVLLIDDHARAIIGDLNSALPDFGFVGQENGEQALRWLHDCRSDGEPLPDAILLDASMPRRLAKRDEEEGLAVLAQLREFFGRIPVIMYSQSTEIDLVVRAIKLGAFWHVPKTASLAELGTLLEKALLESRRGEEVRARETANVSRPVDSQVVVRKGCAFHGMFGSSPVMKRLFAAIARVGPLEACSVWIHGETGTGKELVARALHQLSSRCAKPFVAVNCNSLHGEVQRSELFGTEPGAFTGATRQLGAIRAAHGGTLFLDEIGDLDPATQGLLLRVLENREVAPVGALSHTVKVDVRLVCASHRDLERACRDGAMREDFFYRIVGYRMEVPPLRERGDDILELARAFLSSRFPDKQLSPEAALALRARTWRGNLRELHMVLQHAAIDGEGPWITPALLPREMRGDEPDTSPARPSASEAALASHTTEDLLTVQARELFARCVEDADRQKSLAAFSRLHGDALTLGLLEVARDQYASGKEAAAALGFHYANFRNWLRNRQLRWRE